MVDIQRSAIGCIDFRRPSSISPRRYSLPLARWSFRPNDANTLGEVLQLDPQARLIHVHGYEINRPGSGKRPPTKT